MNGIIMHGIDIDDVIDALAIIYAEHEISPVTLKTAIEVLAPGYVDAFKVIEITQQIKNRAGVIVG